MSRLPRTPAETKGLGSGACLSPAALVLLSRPAGGGSFYRRRKVAHKTGSFPRYKPATGLKPDLDLRGDKGGSDGTRTRGLRRDRPAL